MLNDVNILGSYWTLAAGTAPVVQELCHHNIRDRIECASRAGFTGMGFWHSDLAVLRERHGFAEVKAMLAANGIAHIEVEWLNDWYCTGERRAASDESRALLLDAAEALGANHIKVADLDNDGTPLDRMTEEFATLCAQAAERGTKILFEMLPAGFSHLPSLDHVLSLTRGAGAKNGGIMIDNLHVVRTGTTLADLVEKLTPQDLIGVEINDGVLAKPVDFMDSVINRRRLPGDGEFDIVGFLRAIWSLGYDGPIGVEVMHEYFREWPLDRMAEVSFAKTATVIAEARSEIV
ncbi:sugar phosphate isomerase/epimerase [Sphingobium sp. B2D3A]|uniref:sugar phosphate isomerase/epimerase family protein n=1 Tax=unclassified Sphingobium TaxID=2611147 RepID=UPI00222545AB|nr:MULTISPECIES: sugar phosphate isomerase/epimerase [unclassified Sphingobium]MCW2338885.1 sugar phosphate isomerase/epimerase [Sphingobium sp. B2D3A]MCW2385310.1 sugar phosphate isomerase/epimerase [Sphingobium sp. B2D3D]MCW2387307.1 sugar phosphate isomerase/epimerase [Sphingobium sp. B11D3B]